MLKRMDTFEVQDLSASGYLFSSDSAQLNVNNASWEREKIAFLLSWCCWSVCFPFIFIVYHDMTT